MKNEQFISKMTEAGQKASCPALCKVVPFSPHTQFIKKILYFVSQLRELGLGNEGAQMPVQSHT
jgi:hypothetical protein